MLSYIELQKKLINEPKTWLVTGVAGFIGSNLLEELLRLNQNVVGLDNFETGFQKNIDKAITDSGNKNALSQFNFIEGDIRNLEVCIKACEGVDYVLHQAALGSIPRSIENPINTNQVNIDGFLNMLVAARDSKVERFVYAASSSTYGDHPALPKKEDVIGNPLSPYSVTKLVNELYAKVFHRTYGLNAIGLRYFNVFGKRQNPDGAYAAVIPKWVSSILNSEDVYINGDGSTSRDFCYIENAIQMNLLAATTKNMTALNQVYNVALSKRTSLNELFTLISEKLLTLNPKLCIKEPVFRDFRQGDVMHSLADISKAQKLLGYLPSHNVSQGLDVTMEWYVNDSFL